MAGYIGSKAAVVSSGAERKKTFDITGTTTSLTGLSYTVNQVHVFHNGVRLVDGTDFTATNGNSITLTSAAESGDEVVVISYAGYQVSDTVSASQGGTFAGDVTVSGAFTSQGIDDNATSTAITIDSSENVLVGTTDPDGGINGSSTQGISLSSGSFIGASRSSGNVLELNRQTTDGTIANFRKDGSTVGSIGTLTADPWIARANGCGVRFITAAYIPSNATGNNNGDAVDLGHPSIRFKDAYLSGGVYLGGTGSANRLDDVETGTFSPSIIAYYGNNPVISYFRQQGNYTKVGDLVHVSIMIDIQSASNLSSDLIMVGPLPFAISPSVEADGVSNTSSWSPQRGNHISIGCHSITQSYMGFLTSTPGNGWGWEATSIMSTGASALRLSMTYITA